MRFLWDSRSPQKKNRWALQRNELRGHFATSPLLISSPALGDPQDGRGHAAALPTCSPSPPPPPKSAAEKGIRHHTPAAARSTTGATLRLRNRISSSYSPSARLLRGIRTPVFSAAAGCAAAGVLAAKPCFCTTIHRNEASKQKFKTRGWASGPLAPTTHYSHMHRPQHHETATAMEHTDTRQNTP